MRQTRGHTHFTETRGCIIYVQRIPNFTSTPFSSPLINTCQFPPTSGLVRHTCKIRTLRTSLGVQHPPSVQDVWLHFVRLAHMRSLLDLYVSALRLPLRSTQLSKQTDLPDSDCASVYLSAVQWRVCRPRDHRNGSRALGLQSTDSKPCWR